MPNIASATSSIATLAPAYVPLRKRVRSSIGERRRRSICTNEASATTATTNEPTIRADVQP